MGKVVKKVAGIATLGLVGKSLFGGGKKSAPAQGPVVMPLADDVAVQAKRRRDIAAQLQRGGRSSTILTDSSDSLGGGF